ncbi:hypothetical protein D3C71_1389760 [compost metagenome]
MAVFPPFVPAEEFLEVSVFELLPQAATNTTVNANRIVKLSFFIINSPLFTRNSSGKLYTTLAAVYRQWFFPIIYIGIVILGKSLPLYYPFLE